MICSVFWVITIIFTAQCFKLRKFYLAWSLAVSILLKPHNVVLLPVQIITSRHVNKVFYKSEDLVYNSIAHLWIGYVFYFYQVYTSLFLYTERCVVFEYQLPNLFQGNSNSLANIDVSAGFVGLEEYNLLYSGIMIAAHTNSGHILSFFLSPMSNLVNSVLRIFSLTLYSTFLIFQLDHLFIWSVFSPKLLYETNFTIIFLLLLSFSFVVNMNVQKKCHTKSL